MVAETDTDLPPVICLMGPTASGKTDLAIDLIERLPLDIISVDSAMVYRGMDIGTAKPDAETLARAPHRLVDIVDPSEPYSAGRFRKDARREIADIHAQGRVPLLVGGTMLYYQALLGGLADLPSADAQTRARLDQERAEKGNQGLHARLAEVDPVSTRKIHPNDPQRVQRALEVFEVSGKPMSEFIDKGQQPYPHPVLKLALIPPDLEERRARVESRFGIMLEQGLVAEVQRLYDRGDLSPDLPSIRAVGYRQVWRYLDGEIDFQQMQARGVIATRQLSKRQMTWLRKERDIEILEKPDISRAINLISPLVC